MRLGWNINKVSLQPGCEWVPFCVPLATAVLAAIYLVQLSDNPTESTKEIDSPPPCGSVERGDRSFLGFCNFEVSEKV